MEGINEITRELREFIKREKKKKLDGRFMMMWSPKIHSLIDSRMITSYWTYRERFMITTTHERKYSITNTPTSHKDTSPQQIHFFHITCSSPNNNTLLLHDNYYSCAPAA